MKSMATRQRALGFTLAEMLVVVALAALFMSLAAPSFQRSIATSRQRAAAGELQSALLHARSEAIRTGHGTTVEPAGAAGEWSGGWRAYVDTNANGSFEPGSDRLLTQAPPPRGLAQSAATTAKAFRFGASGFLTAVTNSCVAFVAGAEPHGAGRSVIVSSTGRTRVAHLAPNAASCSA
jgi:type IV fimbrial biogenesis protein FimT